MIGSTGLICMDGKNTLPFCYVLYIVLYCLSLFIILNKKEEKLSVEQLCEVALTVAPA